MLLVNERSDAHVDSVTLSVYQVHHNSEDLATAAIFWGDKASPPQFPDREGRRVGPNIGSALNADENRKVAEIDALNSLQKHAESVQPKG